jgi:hypothetical protein
MSARVISAEMFALQRGFREAELHGAAEAQARAWSFGGAGDIALRYAYRTGIDRFRALRRRRPAGPAGPESAA